MTAVNTASLPPRQTSEKTEHVASPFQVASLLRLFPQHWSSVEKELALSFPGRFRTKIHERYSHLKNRVGSGHSHGSWS
jgi:hypothetical protein